MKYIPLFYATLFCISLVPFSRGQFPQPFNFSPLPSLGASPILDTTALKLTNQMNVFTRKLLSSESRNLAELTSSGQDFSDWRRNVLARFKIRQSTLPRYSANDKTSDLRQFTRYLNALESEFQEQQTQSRLRSVKKQRQKGFNYSMQLMQKAMQKYKIAGDQYHDLQVQQANLFSSCAEIGGASGAIYDNLAPFNYDPNSGEGYLINLLSPSGNIGNVLDPNAIKVKVIAPSNWQFPSGNSGCIGPVVSPSPNTIPNPFPPGYINTNINRDLYEYPDRSSKLGVLYDKIVDLCFDYINDGPSNSDYNDRVLLSLKTQWSDLVMQYSRCVVKYNQVGKKLASVHTRLDDLAGFIQNINTSPYDPQPGWQNSFTNSHSSSFGSGSELSLGNLQNILIG